MATLSMTKRASSHWLADLWLRVIAGFKLVKATLLVAAGVAAVGLLDPAHVHALTRWGTELAADHHYRVLDMVVTRLLNVDEKTLRMVSAGSFLYAALFYVEGIGLFYDKRWAEYLTIVTTAGLIPFELFELSVHVTALKLEVLVANVAIVLYLAWRVTQKFDAADAEERPRAVGDG
jgi:uncharacterized membrane protein (DUF2068 family)